MTTPENSSLAFPTQPEISPLTKPKKKTNKKKSSPSTTTKRAGNVCGFLLFSSEVRPLIREKDPSLGFGMLSKRIGELWRGLSAEDRAAYDARAKIQSENMVAAAEEANRNQAPPLPTQPTPAPEVYTAPTILPRPQTNRQIVQVSDVSDLPDGSTVFLDKDNQLIPYTLKRYGPPKIYYVDASQIEQEYPDAFSDPDSLVNYCLDFEHSNEQEAANTEMNLDYFHFPVSMPKRMKFDYEPPMQINFSRIQRTREFAELRDVQQVLENVLILVEYNVNGSLSGNSSKKNKSLK